MPPKPSLAATPGTVAGNATFIAGGLGAVSGLRCAGVSAGFRRDPQRKDLALIVTEKPAVAAGIFTRNVFCAAPVTVSRQHLSRSTIGDAEKPRLVSAPPPAPASGDASGICAIVLNSGNANASTGEQGTQTAIRTAHIAAEHLGCKPHQVLVASTGVIGVPLAEDLFVTGIPLALANLGSPVGSPAPTGSAASAGDAAPGVPSATSPISSLAAGLAAAEAIMTTDTYPKQAAVTFTATQSDGSKVSYTIGGMVKGSGMIQPNMATLLGVLATDAWLTQQAIELALRQAAGVTFNKVTVDSDTSTNDSVFLLATGATSGKTINPTCPLFEPFVQALTVLCEELARQIAYDGEGATKLVTVNVEGARDDAEADLAARAVANSPLVKTAIAGHDANWGRIAMAIGKSGATFKPQDVDIAIMGMSMYSKGAPVAFDEAEVLRSFDENAEIVINVNLGAGEGRARLWTCDLTHDYITINGDYRT
jgi:glutamate N-acetyltransferase/amino-acid N-acetyltransferase